MYVYTYIQKSVLIACVCRLSQTCLYPLVRGVCVCVCLVREIMCGMWCGVCSGVVCGELSPQLSPRHLLDNPRNKA